MAEAEEKGNRLDGNELLSVLANLSSARHETTTSLIDNGMLALMKHPDERDRLIASDLVDPELKNCSASPARWKCRRTDMRVRTWAPETIANQMLAFGTDLCGGARRLG